MKEERVNFIKTKASPEGMKRKRRYGVLSLALFILGFLFIENGQDSITGAFLGIPPLVSSLAGITLWTIALLAMIGEEEALEEKINTHWKKYRVNRQSILEDMEQEYITREKDKERAPLQKLIEQSVSGGKLIHEAPNKRRWYSEQFYEGHAAQGGRVIDVAGHIEKAGKNKGKLIHFGQPANARYLWIIDEDGNFIVANRQTMRHEMPQMSREKIDLAHRHHKLPHSTLARGKKVYGSGEVVIEGGKIKEFNTASGHYVSLKNTARFNRQGEEVFYYFARKVGWQEIVGGAKYRLKK